ncbi:DUF6734 family protein [Microbacter margulisiae]|uniref:DUF6734 domain-containing protein n=1 Tax=Microbacter margulisiae TaxID=1350067 RepID=A0A7W5H386_9PORP|nr:DUF6734 family protein [Microbacter margulisiae]MBB3188344.1 hypothetical protein [Microbacter margulisiae]
MKVIQSFWGGQHKSIQNSYGWLDYKFHWLGWMLSCHQLVKYYNDVELYTDEFGYDILICKLHLPYTKVHVILDELNNLPNDLWAMAKIKTYSMQKEPFLHVDGDVFIFEPFPEEFINSPLIAQNREFTTTYYRVMWDKIYPNLEYLPEQMESFHQGRNNLAYNMGIVGGNDVSFFKRYSRLSSDFVYQNSQIWDKINLFNFNVFFEQVLFCECADSEEKTIDVLINGDIGDNEYTGFGDFDAVPDNRRYLHLIGVFKRDAWTCYKMLQYCWYHHPEWIKTLFDLTIPDWSQKFDFRFTKDENDELIEWYAKHLEEEEITATRLLARDLFTYEQIRKIDSYEQEGLDYKITLLPEIMIREKQNGGHNVSTKEIFEYSFSIDLDQMSEVILYELSTSRLKSELYAAMLSHFETAPSPEDAEKLQAVLLEHIKYYIGLKIITIYI